MSGAAPALARHVIDDPDELRAFTQWESRASGDAVAQSSLRIGGMHCAACSLAVEGALAAVPGVVEARVNPAAHTARVRWRPDITQASALVQAVERAGYSAVPDTAAQARALREAERRTTLWRVFVAAFCAMQVMMMATPAYVSGPQELAPDLKRLLDWGAWLMTGPVLCFSAAPFFKGAWAALRGRRIGMDVPVALGIGVAFVASTGAAFDPGGIFGTQVYFDSLTMFIAFLLIGRAIEMKARHKAAEQLEATLDRLPEGVQRVLASGGCETVSAQRLRPGDIVRVPVGQAFAADGVLTNGQTDVDESLLNGESRPVAKQQGDAVVAGSLNQGAPVEMCVERVGEDTRYEAIVALMREALSQRPALGRVADRWAGPFLAAVLVLAAAGAAAWSVIDPSRAVWVAVSVLIVTCPCALSLAVPSALLSAAASLGRRGVLLRRLDALETLARLQHLFVDKTGTLTQTAPSLACTHVLPSGEAEGETLLRGTAASLATWSNHPLSRALASNGEASAVAWHGLKEERAAGLQALDARGRRWRLGSRAWAAPDAPRELRHEGLWLSRDGVALACFEFSERARGDSARAIARLAGEGVDVTLLSGDSPARALAMGRALGLGDCRGGLAPQDKLAAVRAEQAKGRVVAMAGDGINDAPVLAQADVAFAMGEGAAVARSHADAVLVGNSLMGVAVAHELARRTMRVIRQNLLWSAAYNAACVPLALTGWLPPWAAGLGMACSSLFVVINSLRLAR